MFFITSFERYHMKGSVFNMFADGLYAAKMTLHIYRDDGLIPNGAQNEPICLELSATQMSAIAAVLGLGYNNGNLLYYKDSDVKKNIERTDGFGVQALYHFIICNSRKDRIVKRADTLAASHQTERRVSVPENDDLPDYSLNEEQHAEDSFVRDRLNDCIDGEDTCPADNGNIMLQAAASLGMSFSGMGDGSGVIEQPVIQTGMPMNTDNPFSSR